MSIVAIKKNVLREIQKLNKLPDSKLFLAILVAVLWLLKPSTSAPFRCCMLQDGWHYANGRYHPQDPPLDQLQPEARGRRLPAYGGIHQMIAMLQHPVATKHVLGMLSGVGVISQNLKWKLGTDGHCFPLCTKKKIKNMRESCEDQPHHAVSTDSECRALPNAEQGHAGSLIIRP